MLIPRSVAWMFIVSIIVFASGAVSGQTASIGSGQAYPNKPVRIVTTVPGSGTDLIARLIAQSISGSLGQPMIVDNRGIIAVELAAKAPPDGYTLLLYTSPLWLLPLFRRNVPWNPVKDFSPITLTSRQPSILVVHPSVPVTSVKELIALAKAKPGELNYGSGSTGAPTHLAAELFNATAGVKLVRIPFKGGGLAINALMGGEVQVMFGVPAAVTPHVKSGKLRSLAVTSAEPSALAPGLPTVAASGLPGYESTALSGMFAPAKTPEAIIKVLNDQIVRILNGAEVKERLFNAGIEVVASSPEEFAAAIKSEMTRMGKVIKDAGLRE